MPLQHYEIKEHADDGRVYAVVTLEDGRTFGQYIDPGTQSEMDAQIAEHVARVEQPQQRPAMPAIGTKRSALQIEADKAPMNAAAQ